jgi:CheY-like chemotaxis protein
LPSDARRLDGLRLLVVEDEALVAILIEDIVLDLGCVVVGPAASVAQALALLEREAVDGAVLDVNLGADERSYAIAEALGARGIPFIFVTGYGEEGVDPRFAAVEVIQKPFEPCTLERSVVTHLARPAANRRRRRRR